MEKKSFFSNYEMDGSVRVWKRNHKILGLSIFSIHENGELERVSHIVQRC